MKKFFEAPQETETPAPRCRGRRMPTCPKCKSMGQGNQGCHEGLWANGMCWRHAVESGCQPPIHRHNRMRKMCKKCQEIVQKEEKAADRGFKKKWVEHLVRTKPKLALWSPWAEGLCWPHARQAGFSKEKLFNNAGMMKKPHLQKKLSFCMNLKKSQSQMAEVGSIEPSLEESALEEDNPLDAQSMSESDTILDVHSCETDLENSMEDVSPLEEEKENMSPVKEEEKPPKRKKNENPIVWMSKIKLEESVVEELVVPEPKRKPRRPAGSKSENKSCFVEVGGKIMKMKIKMEEVQGNVDAEDSG
jgi:hypothetical protein